MKIKHYDRQNRTKLDNHHEHLFESVGDVQADEFIQEDHMARAADRKPFGNALHNAEQDCFE